MLLIKTRAVLVLTLMAATPALQAQTTAADCVSITGSMERLACYDGVSARMTALPPTALQVTASATPGSAPKVEEEVMPAGTLLDKRWDLDGSKAPLYKPRTYRPMYVLPLTWTNNVNSQPTSPAANHSALSDLGVKATEAKFQISLKSKLAEDILGTDISLWAGYTQSSHWQIYNSKISRPFRETNYEPEVIMVVPLRNKTLGWNMRFASLSLNHQSNGRAEPLSRSWNRVIGSLVFERDDWVIEVRPWQRLAEPANSDDNPDIEDYIGRGELMLNRFYGDHLFGARLRHSLRGGERSRGSVQLQWAFPINGSLHGFLQVFNGYGESLIDYNHKQTMLGLGVTLADWH